MATNLDSVCEIIAATFEIPVETVNKDSSSQTIEQWDSIGHINVVMELEQKYGIAFTMEEIAKIHDVQTICKMIDQKSRKGDQS
jgi:acyl carrier protein